LVRQGLLRTRPRKRPRESPLVVRRRDRDQEEDDRERSTRRRRRRSRRPVWTPTKRRATPRPGRSNRENGARPARHERVAATSTQHKTISNASLEPPCDAARTVRPPHARLPQPDAHTASPQPADFSRDVAWSDRLRRCQAHHRLCLSDALLAASVPDACLAKPLVASLVTGGPHDSVCEVQEPSNPQSGALSHSFECVTGVLPVPSARITKMSALPSTPLVAWTIHLPSGE
jgi:hypothetical protein